MDSLRRLHALDVELQLRVAVVLYAGLVPAALEPLFMDDQVLADAQMFVWLLGKQALVLQLRPDLVP